MIGVIRSYDASSHSVVLDLAAYGPATAPPPGEEICIYWTEPTGRIKLVRSMMRASDHDWALFMMFWGDRT